MLDLPLNLQIAQQAALAAGKLLAKNASFVIKESSSRDSKLSADTDSENVILDILRSQSTFPILSEEAGGELVSGPIWIVDPLDGTVNYSRGIPIGAVSISLWNSGQPLLGVVYDFTRDELFTGIVGIGARLGEHKIDVGTTSAKEHAIVFTGLPIAQDFSSASINEFVKLVQGYKKVRIIGSAALSLAYVAAGRGDVYFERSIRLWDVAAGIALVLAAGGRVTKIEVKGPDTLNVYADNSRLPPLL